MIPLRQVSPSSISKFDECQMKWFLEYILKHREPTGKAALIGTVCHAVLEAVGQSMQARQKRGKNKVVENKFFGPIGTVYDMNELAQKSIQHFQAENPHIVFTEPDLEEIYSNLETAKDHPLFPENHKKIIATEFFFNKAVGTDWSKYTVIEDGVPVEKEVRIIGVIDLVFENKNGEIGYLDYKFGRAYDWNKNTDKTFTNLAEDIQLCLYYWAMKQDYPVDDINTHIWYVKAGKTFNMHFDESNERTALDKLEQVVLAVKNMQKPSCNYTWKCKNYCQFSKKNFADFGLEVDLPYVAGAKFPAVNGSLCVCDATNVMIDKRGIDLVVENCKKV